jgi:hypothetical protein
LQHHREDHDATIIRQRDDYITADGKDVQYSSSGLKKNKHILKCPTTQEFISFWENEGKKHQV